MGENCLKTPGIVVKRRARGSPMGKAETRSRMFSPAEREPKTDPTQIKPHDWF